jgi:cytochrome c oxidase subunit 2
MGKIIGLAVVLIAGGIFFFFGKDIQKAEAPTGSDAKSGIVGTQTSVPPVSGTENTPGVSAGKTQEISVEAHNWYFEPEEIRVKEGTKVKILLKGVSGAHTFALPDFSVKSQEVEPGDTATVEFVADKKGEFSFKCSVFCGEGHSGMTGKFIVE